MTKKEFLSRMSILFKNMEDNDFARFSCWTIRDLFPWHNNLINQDYNYFIYNYLDEVVRRYLKEERKLTPKLRMLLLQGFKEEVLSTKRYLKY